MFHSIYCNQAQGVQASRIQDPWKWNPKGPRNFYRCTLYNNFQGRNGNYDARRDMVLFQ